VDRILKSIALSGITLALLYWGTSLRSGTREDKDMARAIAAWHADPKPATQAAIERQRSVMHMHDQIRSFVFFGGLLSVVGLAVHTWWPRSHKDCAHEHSKA
jgi:hypothetical protein